MALGWILGWIWGPSWGQVGTKIDQKSKLKKACNKDDVRELLNVKILGQSGAWELLNVKKNEKIRPAAVGPVQLFMLLSCIQGSSKNENYRHWTSNIHHTSNIYHTSNLYHTYPFIPQVDQPFTCHTYTKHICIDSIHVPYLYI